MDRIENKIIDDKLTYIDPYRVMNLFSCNFQDAIDIIQNYFNNRKFYAGVINLMNCKIDLGKLKEIGDLSLIDVDIETLGGLKKARTVIISNCDKIETLGSLTQVEKLQIYGAKNLTSMGKLSSIEGGENVHSMISSTGLKSLGELLHVDGEFKLAHNKELTDLGKLQNISGSLHISKCPELKNLGPLRVIGESLDIREASVDDFGNLIDLGGYVITSEDNVNWTALKDNYEVVDMSPLLGILTKYKFSYLRLRKVNKLENFGLIVQHGNQLAPIKL